MDTAAQDAAYQRAIAFLITFSCYGCRLHGDDRGTVDRHNNLPETPALPSSDTLRQHSTNRMSGTPYSLDKQRAAVSLKAILGVCQYRGWKMLAAHLRPEHVHVVVHAKVNPERILVDFKAYATRGLKKISPAENAIEERWARHGSTRYLFDVKAVDLAIHYTLREQGEPFVMYEADDIPGLIGKILAGQ